MPGASFVLGDQKIRPGVYVRTTQKGTGPAAGVAQGTVAVCFKATWGPLGLGASIQGGAPAVAGVYGSDGTTLAPVEAFNGGALTLIPYRLGSTGATAATVAIKDTNAAPATVMTLPALYQGSRGNNLSVTIRDSLTDNTKRECLIWEGTTLRQTIVFAKGAGEPAALQTAINASNSQWVGAPTGVIAGTGLLAAVAQSPFAGGIDPTVAGTDYTAALNALEAQTWNVLVTDTEDPSIHATIQAFIDRVRNNGKRVLGAVGEATSVALATRQTDAKAFNDPAIVYVANGFVGTDNVTREGYKAAARIAGMIASAPVNVSLTGQTIAGASSVQGLLSNTDTEACINAGALVFSLNALGQVQVEYGINTLITLSADQDAGWRKIRRMRTRDNLIDRIVQAWAGIKAANSPSGRATLIAIAQGVINQMVAEGSLLGGSIAEDKAHPAAGDSAWFITTVDDLDSAEKAYNTFVFEYSPS